MYIYLYIYICIKIYISIKYIYMYVLKKFRYGKSWQNFLLSPKTFSVFSINFRPFVYI